MTFLSVVRLRHLGTNMNELKKHQKSAVRVAHMALTHLCVHRLFPCDPRTKDLAELEVLGRALLDYAESLALAPRGGMTSPASTGAGTAAGGRQKKRLDLEESGDLRFCR